MVLLASHRAAAAVFAALIILALPQGAEARSVLVAVGTPGVVLVDQTSGRVGSPIGLGGPAVAVATAPDGARGYVATGRRIATVDLVQRNVAGYASLRSGLMGLAVSPNGSRLLAGRRGAVDVLATSPLPTALATIRLSSKAAPRSIAVSSDGARALVLHDRRRVAILDLFGLRVRPTAAAHGRRRRRDQLDRRGLGALAHQGRRAPRAARPVQRARGPHDQARALDRRRARDHAERALCDRRRERLRARGGGRRPRQGPPGDARARRRGSGRNRRVRRRHAHVRRRSHLTHALGSQRAQLPPPASDPPARRESSARRGHAGRARGPARHRGTGRTARNTRPGPARRARRGRPPARQPPRTTSSSAGPGNDDLNGGTDNDLLDGGPGEDRLAASRATTICAAGRATTRVSAEPATTSSTAARTTTTSTAATATTRSSAARVTTTSTSRASATTSCSTAGRATTSIDGGRGSDRIKGGPGRRHADRVLGLGDDRRR